MKHQIAIIAKFLPCTDTKGSRVSLKLPRWENKRIERSWSHAITGLENQVDAILLEAGIESDNFSEISATEYSFQVPFDQVDKVKALFNI